MRIWIKKSLTNLFLLELKKLFLVVNWFLKDVSTAAGATCSLLELIALWCQLIYDIVSHSILIAFAAHFSSTKTLIRIRPCTISPHLLLLLAPLYIYLSLPLLANFSLLLHGKALVCCLLKSVVSAMKSRAISRVRHRNEFSLPFTNNATTKRPTARWKDRFSRGKTREKALRFYLTL